MLQDTYAAFKRLTGKIEELKEHISNLEIVRNEMKADIDVCRCENEYYS